ncbi:MAG: IS66 family transposase [Candidatus Methylomirabilis sp.]
MADFDLNLDLDLDRIPDPATRLAVGRLLNLVEHLYAENLALRAENLRLNNEIARLKGEQGKPSFPANRPASPNPPPAPPDHSSERERRQPKPWHKAPKRHRIVIDRVVSLPIDPASLPPDAQFKGYAPFLVQDLVLKTDNVLFFRALYYSPSRSQSFAAPLPPGHSGHYGPGIRTLALVLSYGCLVGEKPIHALFTDAGIEISTGQISSFLIHGHEQFHTEAQAVLRAGLSSSPWQNLDDTPTRVNGQNHACFTLGNPLYTAYRTLASKERLSVLLVLQGGETLRYRLNETALGYLKRVGVSQKLWERVAALSAARAPDEEWEETSFLSMLASELAPLGPQQRQRVREAAALAAYRAQEGSPVAMLVCDDAPQWREITEALALCWVHDGRHYTKLSAYLAPHRTLLEEFRKSYWEFYRKLRRYQEQPTTAEATRLEAEFDALFGEETGYDLLDDRIRLTRGKKKELLTVLMHPEAPLHNNAAELGVRRRVRKRDVSFGPRTDSGTQAWDTFQTVAATASKLGISFYHYLYDRMSGANRMPALAEVIEERARDLDLGASWRTLSEPAAT